jgi:hypothetical protein
MIYKPLNRKAYIHGGMFSPVHHLEIEEWHYSSFQFDKQTGDVLLWLVKSKTEWGPRKPPEVISWEEFKNRFDPPLDDDMVDAGMYLRGYDKEGDDKSE